MSRVPAICFYGDDFTGSTDALANFASWGVSARLVLDPLAISRMAGDVEVLGVAGRARSLATEDLERELSPVFAAFAGLGPELVQYKVCSTFDSSPRVGSIGRACEIAVAHFGAQAVPVLAAQPDLGRWTLFSHHFARGFDGRTYRLDRHPTMSRHPVTPALESDLRLVLGDQTDLPVRGLHRGELAGYRDLVCDHRGLVVLDALDDGDLRRAGAVIRAEAHASPQFTVGSGGLSYALASTFGRQLRLASPRGESGPVLAVSGSASADTARQIAAAEAAGWLSTSLDVGVERAVDLAARALASGRSVVVHSTIGSPPGAAVGSPGLALGAVAAGALARGGARRLLVAGGDTAGAVVAVLGGDALDYLAPVGGSGALCVLRSAGADLDGLEVVLKGGQVGGVHFFERVRLGLVET